MRKSLPIAVLATALATGSASARTDLGAISLGMIGQLGEVKTMIFAGSAALGLLMVASGLLKLKAAADTQGQQIRYSDAIWRLFIGAGLFALPALIPVLTQTFGLSTETMFTDLAK